MKIFDSRKSIVMASMGVLFATLALVSCEKREESLLNDMAKYSKTVVFTEQQVQTRATAYTDYNTQMPYADYVLRAEESTDSMFLSAYVTDLESEQLKTRATEATLSTLNQFYVLAYNEDGSLNRTLSKSVVPTDDTKTQWRYTPHINWSELGNNTVQFYGYANVIADNASQVSDSKFELTIPENANAQTDIIIAKASQTYTQNSNQQVPLEFNHVLTGVRFIKGDRESGVKDGRILKVELEGITTVATYDIINNEWDLATEKGNSYLNISDETKMGENIFMLIPQGPFGTTSKINVYYGT